MNIKITDLDMILNYLETTSLEPHDDYSSEFTYKDQKILYKYIKQLQQENKKQKEIIDRIDKYIKENIYSYYDSKGEKCIEETVFERSANPKELLDILKEVSEWEQLILMKKI
mgnify:CR=1 FL=1